MSSKYRIVPAGDEDLTTIEDLAHRIWPDTFGDILSPAQIAYMLEMMYSRESLVRQREDGCVFLLVEDTVAGHPIGYLSYQIDYLPGTTKIHKIYLLPETQGRGLGRMLLEAAERIAVAAGQQALRLDVNYQNPAVGFYEHYGFVKLGRFNADIGNGYLMEDWQMEKPLQSA